jgi:hypothetical protein
VVVWRTSDSGGAWLFEKSPVPKNKYPSTLSASTVMTTLKRRKRTFTMLCLVPADAGFNRTADFNDRRRGLDDGSLTRTRFASQEEQEACCQLLEEGCEKISFGFVQRGQAIVIMDQNSSQRGPLEVVREGGYLRSSAGTTQP